MTCATHKTHAGISGIGLLHLCPSGRMDADEITESLEKPNCKTRLHKLSRRIVEVLLDISEEHVKEQEAYEIPNQTGWDEAVSNALVHVLLFFVWVCML